MKQTTPVKTSAAFMVTGLVVFGMVLSVAWAKTQQVQEGGFAWKDGAEVYGKVCGLCHDTKVGPVLLGRGIDPLYIKIIVRNGLRAMPAFRSSEIDDQTLEKLAEYISKTAADK